MHSSYHVFTFGENMSENPAELVIELLLEGGEPAELDELTRQLRTRNSISIQWNRFRRGLLLKERRQRTLRPLAKWQSLLLQRSFLLFLIY